MRGSGVTWRRGLLLVVAMLGLGLGLAVVVAVLPPRQTGEVPMPGQDATPEQVVTAFTRALDAHDCTTAVALATEGGRDQAERWCHDIGALQEVEVGSSVTEDPAWSGLPAGTEVVHVPVSFELTWRRFHADGSMDEGVTAWGYRLVRATPDEPWRIIDQGVA